MGQPRLIALDPGATTGWAVFEDGLLVRSGTQKVQLPHVELIEDPEDAVVVVEWPQFRTGSRTPVEDLLQLALRAGLLAGLYMARGGKVELVRPTTWKGSVPKEIHQKRIHAALGELERAKVGKNHNAVDAVGLGLWQLGRLKR